LSLRSAKSVADVDVERANGVAIPAADSFGIIMELV
jgi:hypothetical protein